MNQHLVKIKSIKHIAHDVLQIVTEKPKKFSFNPVQASEVAINKNGRKDEIRPFTITSIPENDFLEFTIKTYPTQKSVSNELQQLENGDELIQHDVFGAIAYQGEAVFIAGGSGVTPFICIFRYLQSKNETGGNKLIFANKTKDDIILALEFKELLGENFINIFSEELTGENTRGQTGEEFLKDSIAGFDHQYYMCGPPPMMDTIQKQLALLGIEKKQLQ